MWFRLLAGTTAHTNAAVYKKNASRRRKKRNHCRCCCCCCMTMDPLLFLISCRGQQALPGMSLSMAAQREGGGGWNVFKRVRLPCATSQRRKTASEVQPANSDATDWGATKKTFTRFFSSLSLESTKLLYVWNGVMHPPLDLLRNKLTFLRNYLAERDSGLNQNLSERQL